MFLHKTGQIVVSLIQKKTMKESCKVTFKLNSEALPAARRYKTKKKFGHLKKTWSNGSTDAIWKTAAHVTTGEYIAASDANCENQFLCMCMYAMT